MQETLRRGQFSLMIVEYNDRKAEGFSRDFI